MATDIQKLIDLQRLSEYDQLIKGVISTEDAKSLKYISYDSNTRTASFYKTEDGSGNPSYQIVMPDTSSFLEKFIMEGAQQDGHENYFVKIAADGTLTETQYIPADKVSVTDSEGNFDATNVEAALAEIVDGLGTAAASDVATTAIVEDSSDDSLVTAAQVATFVASEISSLETAMHFVGVITRQEGETDAQAIARVVTSPVAGDVVVMSDNAKEYIYSGSAWREVGDEGLYVQKSTTIAGVNLEDNITKSELLTALNVEDGAQENIIESVKVNDSALTITNKAVDITIAEGSTNGTLEVNGTDVAVHGLGSAAYTATTDYDAAGTAQGLVDALTADDIEYIAADPVEGTPSVSVASALNDIYSQIGSGGSVDQQIQAAIEALDADLDATGTAQHSGTFVVSGVTEVDGVLTAVDSVEVEAAGAAAAAVAALDSSTDDNGISDTADSSLNVLTSVTITDGLISAKKHLTLNFASSSEIQALFS